jgi:ABC-2 type transport system permease protein
MMAIGQLIMSAIEFVGTWVLFNRFKSLNGWSLPEAAFFYGIVNTAFALTEGLGRGFDTFPGIVKDGGFDRLLVRPRSTVFQVAVREIQFMRIGRLSQGILILIWSMNRLTLVEPWQIALTLFSVLGAASVFYALFVIAATISFWTTESLELINTVTYGGTEAAQYPISIYKPWFQKLFVFFVPLACVTYFPALAILGRVDSSWNSPLWFQILSPFVGIIFLFLSFIFWRFGVSRYCSTGS